MKRLFETTTALAVTALIVGPGLMPAVAQEAAPGAPLITLPPPEALPTGEALPDALPPAATSGAPLGGAPTAPMAETPTAPALPAPTLPDQALPDPTLPNSALPNSALPGLGAAPIAGSGQTAPAATPGPAPVPPLVPTLETGADPAAPGNTPLLAERDRGNPESADLQGWLLPPRPLTPLQNGVFVGASLPEPGILRLTGETASTTLALDLPPGDGPDTPLRLTLRSSVNVLSDLARMSVSVNGAEPITLPLNNLAGFGAVDLPASALTGGRNLIALTLNQPHRIFCGPEATFGVWTEIALDQSGLRLPEEALTADAAGFALAGQSQTTGGRSLPLLVAEDENPALVRAMAGRLRAAFAPAGRVDVQPFYALGPRPLASVALIASDRANASFRRGAGGGIVLQIEHVAGELPDLSALLPDPAALAAAMAAEGKPLPAAPGNAAHVTPGTPITLAGLGAGDIIGNTHYFRRDISFGLPGDWLLMANQKARLDLSYGFARALPEGAILLVKVNEETVRLLPLDREGGQILPTLPVEFNANLLRPGRNQLSFEMMVPGDPPTQVCPVRRSDMLVVLGDSVLTVPESPAMQLPGLTTALLRLDPDQVLSVEGSSNPAELDQISMSIAGELAPRETTGDPVSLRVADLADLALAPLETAGLSISLVQDLLFPSLDAPVPAAVSTAPTPAAAPARPSFTLDDSAEAAPATAEEGPGLASRIWDQFSPRDWLAREYRTVRDSAFVGSTLPLRDWLAGRSGNALLLRPDVNQPSDLWLILGPDANPRATGAAIERLRGDGLAQGEAALLTADGTWQIWSPIRTPRMLETPDPLNIRTVIGNYASWSPFLFTVSMLVLALLSALPALFYVLLSRREGGGTK